VEVLLIQNHLHVKFSICVIVKPVLREVLQVFVHVKLLDCMQNIDFSKQWWPMLLHSLVQSNQIPSK